MLDPLAVERLYPITLDAPMAVSEIRAVFGGMMSGIGAAVCWLAIIANRPRDAGVVMMLVFGGLVLARIVGITGEGFPTDTVLHETIFEVVILILLYVTGRNAENGSDQN